MAAVNANVLQIKVSLTSVRPPVWRRILVPAGMTLAELHEALQIAMGWTNGHLHQFIKGQTYYGSPDDEEFDSETIDESTVQLATIFRAPKSSIVYEYDFGDGWDHRLVLEKTLQPDPDGVVPRCVAGSGACPLEDCGGPYGYADLLKTLRDPKSPRYEDAREFAPEGFDPAKFDIAEVNEELAAYARGERPAILDLFDDDDEDDEESEEDAADDLPLGKEADVVLDALLKIVDKQIRTNNPPETRQTLNRLKSQGMPEDKAKSLIMAVLYVEILDVIQTTEPADIKRYVRNLERLPEEPQF